MFRVEELKRISFFDCVPDAHIARMAATAADLHLCGGEWLIREGEMPYFFILVEGALEVISTANPSP